MDIQFYGLLTIIASFIFFYLYSREMANEDEVIKYLYFFAGFTLLVITFLINAITSSVMVQYHYTAISGTLNYTTTTYTYSYSTPLDIIGKVLGILEIAVALLLGVRLGYKEILKRL